MRGRLTMTIVALVVLTATVLGVAAYVFVDASLHDRLLRDAEADARFDLATLIPTEIESGASLEDWRATRLPLLYESRDVDALPDFGNLDASFTRLLSPPYREAIARGEVAFQWTSISGQPRLVVGGPVPGRQLVVHFVHDAAAIETALAQLRLGLAGGALLLTLLALVTARLVAGGVLAPVDVAARAAERMERGDLAVRVPVTSNDEFGRLARRFNRMAATLEETIGHLETAQAQNRRFVSDVAHELRTPLTALVAEASILREHLGELPPGARRTGELLVDDVGRLRTLVDELMELSRFDASAEEARREPVDLGRLVRAIVDARLPDAALDAPAEPLVVTTDPRRLERIVGNLLDNAREHAAGQEVEVTVTAQGDDVVIAVADRGPGVPEDRLPRIFDRFYKADPSRHGGSSGLGLAIAAEHAALLGGELEAANRDGGGLWTWLRLPVTEPLPPGDGAATATADRGMPQEPTREPLR